MYLFGALVAFGGGTALSKAHHLLHRFPKDIDFRLVLPAAHSESRSRLSGIFSYLYTVWRIKRHRYSSDMEAQQKTVLK
jgi:predicted nucleotidyltransferase component of viral defense system